MKICHVITRLIIGGAQENTVLTCRGLVERGHEVILIAGPETGPEGSLWDQARQTGCSIESLDSLRRKVSLRTDWQARRDLTAIFKRIQPDIVHTHSSKAGIIGREAAAIARVSNVVHTIHGMSFNRTQPAMTQWFYRMLERRAAHMITAFVSVADAMTDQAVAAGLAPQSRFTTIRSGMEVDRFKPDLELRKSLRKQWGISENEVVVGTVARLFKNKGYEDIIQAIPQAVEGNKKLTFVWVGDGAHRNRYEQSLQAINMRDRVHMTGLVLPTEIPKLINGFDILVHASHWEGLPRTVVQASLMEVPAISYDNDGAPEVVITNETGVLVKCGHTDQLAKSIVQLSTDPEQRRKLGRAAREKCLTDFDWNHMVDQLEKLYTDLISRQENKHK